MGGAQDVQQGSSHRLKARVVSRGHVTRHIFFTKGTFLPYFWAERREADSPPVFAISYYLRLKITVTSSGVAGPDRLRRRNRSVFLRKNKFKDMLTRKCLQLHLEAALCLVASPEDSVPPLSLAPGTRRGPVFWLQQLVHPAGCWSRQPPDPELTTQLSLPTRRGPLLRPSSVPSALAPRGERRGCVLALGIPFPSQHLVESRPGSPTLLRPPETPRGSRGTRGGNRADSCRAEPRLLPPSTHASLGRP